MASNDDTGPFIFLVVFALELLALALAAVYKLDDARTEIDQLKRTRVVCPMCGGSVVTLPEPKGESDGD